MAEEILNLKVNSNIKSVTKDTEEYGKSVGGAEKKLEQVNSTLKEQKDILMFLQKEQIKLEQARSKQTEYEQGLSGINKKLSNLKLEIKDQNLAVKDLTMQQREAKDSVKEMTNAQKEQGDTLLSNIGNYKVMGISLNGIKGAFKQIIPTAKVMFATIKSGLISTGIGALVVAFGTLMTWFMKTKKGAETLSKIFAGVGAAVSVIVDRITGFATAVGKLFSGDIKGALSGMKGSFTGIGAEMSKEIALAVQLKADLHALADSERALNVETANRRAEIEDLKLKADDLNLTEQERIAAIEEAGDIERGLMAERVANAEEAVRIQQQQMAMSNNLKADLDELAAKEITLANIRRESFVQQRTIQRKTNRIKKQNEAKEKAAQQAWKRRQEERIKAQNQTVIMFNQMRREELLKTLKNERNREKTQALWKRDEREKLIEETVFDEQKKNKLLGENFTFYQMERKRIDKKYDKISIDAKKQMAADLLAIENETLLLTIGQDMEVVEAARARGQKELEIAKELELKGVEGRTDTEELKAAIEDKYIALSRQKKDAEAEEDKQRDKDVIAAKVQALSQGLEVIASFMDLQSAQIEKDYDKEIKLAKGNEKDIAKIEAKFADKRRDQAKKMKAMKIAMAIVDTYQSAVSAYAAGLSVGGPAGLVLGPVSAGLAVLAGLANVAMIEKQPLGDGGGGGGASAAAGGGAPPAPEMMSGAFELTGGQEVEPMQAYVVSDDITDSQNALAIIRRRATI